MLVPIILSLVLVFGVQSAYADRFSDWLEAFYKNQITELELQKRGQEEKAVEYQKNVLRLDYSKILNFGVEDKKFTAPVETEGEKKKQIQRYVPSGLKY